MIARADQVDILLLEDIEGIATLGFRAIVEAVAFDSVAGIYENKVDAFAVCSSPQVVGKGYVVSPICGKRGPIRAISILVLHR